MIETLEASPQRDVYFLQQIVSVVRIGLVSTCQPLQGWTKTGNRFLVNLILRGLAGRLGFSRDHFALTAFLRSHLGSHRAEKFLTSVVLRVLSFN